MTYNRILFCFVLQQDNVSVAMHTKGRVQDSADTSAGFVQQNGRLSQSAILHVLPQKGTPLISPFFLHYRINRIFLFSPHNGESKQHDSVNHDKVLKITAVTALGRQSASLVHILTGTTIYKRMIKHRDKSPNN